MRVDIFDVEHGACALLTLDDGKRIAIDCGHNATTGWTLGRHLRRMNVVWLDELWLTNLDQDHLSGLCDLWGAVAIGNILINPSISADYLWTLKYAGGQPTDDIRLLCQLIRSGLVNRPLQTLPKDVLIHYAWNVAGARFNDTNNLSLACSVHLGRVHFLFPGDLEEAGMTCLLSLPIFANSVRSTHVLVAPHHGRDSGCCDLLFEAMADGGPQICVISDGAVKYESQLTQSWYANRISGIKMENGTVRKVLTTRSDGHITIEIPPGQLGIVSTARHPLMIPPPVHSALSLADIFRQAPPQPIRRPSLFDFVEQMSRDKPTIR
jgi:beta-lactamase superfamily II metal-dependent hydrolase